MSNTPKEIAVDDKGNVFIEALLRKAPAATQMWAWDAAVTVEVYFADDIVAWTATEKSALMAALQTWSAVANITFQATTTRANADLVEHKITNAYFGAGLYGKHAATERFASPQPQTYDANVPLLPVPASDVGELHGYFNSQQPSWANLAAGSAGFFTLVHELGHALGLAHPHDNGGGSGVFPGASGSTSLGTPSVNHRLYTVMSYNATYTFDSAGKISLTSGFDINGQENYGYIGGPGAFDIAAIQAIYGARSVDAGDSYTLGDTNGAWKTLYDTGTSIEDTISYAGSKNTFMDLRAATLDGTDISGGGLNYVSGVFAGYTIAQNVAIEKAVGGRGVDTIRGNALANTFTGNGGDDVIDGEGGADVAVYRGYQREYKVTKVTATEYLVEHQGGGRIDGSDRLVNVERLRFRDGEVDIDKANAGAGKLDFVFLQDLSGSFGDDIATVKSIAPSLLSSIKSFSASARFGVTSFVDKPISPYGSSGDYEYRLHLGLTESDSAAVSAINGFTIFHGADLPEAQLSGLYGVGTDSGVGFRADAQKIVLVLTDANYHTEAGYPTVASIKSLFDGANIIPIFAVTGGNESAYNGLVSQLGRGRVVTLTSNSDNIVDAVSQAIGSASVAVVPGATSGADTMAGTASAENFFSGLGDDRVNAGGGDDDVDGGAGRDTLIGGAGADSMRGGTGTDTLWGGGESTPEGLDEVGDDILIGGADADAIHGGGGFDTAAYTAAVVLDLANRSADVGEVVGDTFTSVERHAGSQANDKFFGLDSGNENFAGGGGDDELHGRGGADTVSGDEGQDRLFGEGGDDIIYFDATDLVVDGGTGYDAAIAHAATGPVAVNLLAQGLEKVIGSVGSDRLDGSGSGVAVDLQGGAGLDQLIGGAIGDLIDGGSGDDTMLGGLGDDVYIVDSTGDSIVEDLGGGTDTVRTGLIAYSLAAGVENLLSTGVAAFTGVGNELANRITGSFGNDLVDGRGGADVMVGGAGDDTYIVDSAADAVVESTNVDPDDDIGHDHDLVDAEGDHDTVIALVTYGLAANVENLTLSGSAPITGIGNGLANSITGNASDNVIDGGAGSDTMAGGAGNDVYFTDVAGDLVVEGVNAGIDTVNSFFTTGLGANVENLNLMGSAVAGIGNGLSNVINGNGADNVIDGGAGVDVMAAGLGNDVYFVDNAGDVVSEAFGSGTDTVNSSISAGLGANIENLNLIGTAAINGIGNGLNNAITGNGADNMIDGGAGADAMAGGGGNDVYFVDNAGDQVTENAGGGIDTIVSSVTLTLGPEIENLTLIGSAAVNGTGNGAGNTINGNAAANVIDGGGGADVMNGAGGDDVYFIDVVGDLVVEGVNAGIDTVNSFVTAGLGANVENLNLLGSATTGIGNGLSNVINGNGADNVIDGGTGVDVMAAGLGNDVYFVDNAGDVVSEAPGSGTDAVNSSISAGLGANIENLNLIGTAAINGIGNGLNNAIMGNGAANMIDGGAGADAMAGGGGNDVYFVDNAGDQVTENAGGGVDTIVSSVTLTLGSEVENLTLIGSAAVNGTGNGAGNTINGNAAANVIDGGGGADVMIGAGGDDTYRIDVAFDQVIEQAGGGTDTLLSSLSIGLAANVENLTLLGSATTAVGNGLSNVINGNGADNVIDGGAGVDVMAAGLGNDVYFVDNIGDVVTEALGSGTDAVNSSISAGLGANVENLNLIGTAAINGIGNGLNNAIMGNGADNMIDGGAGTDAMAGGGGNDVYFVDNAGDQVTEYAGGGVDTIVSSVTLTLGSEVENLTLIGSAAVNGTGNGAGNTINGNAAANVIDGGGGADVMIGAGGDDTYWIDMAGDQVIEQAGGGTDTLLSSLSIGLAANVENLTLLGSATTAIGNGLSNAITGNGADNLIDGGAGFDSMAGGGGNDVYFVDQSSEQVTEAANAGTDAVNTTVSYVLGANIETLNLMGSAAINGTGNGLNNTINGNAAANAVDGGAGADTMAGGGGDDVYAVDNSGDAVVEGSGGGNDTINSSVTAGMAANVENLNLTGSGAISGIGNALDNVITGNGADNAIDGASGADAMAGGGGNDVYYVDSVGDSVVEAVGAGTDTVNSSVGLRLGDNVENLYLLGSAGLNGIGNALGNAVRGNLGSNSLDGAGGADTLFGDAGNDAFIFGAGQAGGDVVLDFAGNGAAAGDLLAFSGFGPGATFTSVNATQWAITYNGGSSQEIITFSNGASIDASDFFFV